MISSENCGSRASVAILYSLLFAVPLEMGPPQPRSQHRSRGACITVKQPRNEKGTILHIPLADGGWEQFSFLRRRSIHSALDNMNPDTAKHNHSNQSLLHWINKSYFNLNSTKTNSFCLTFFHFFYKHDKIKMYKKKQNKNSLCP